jgi:DNA helicase-2/ATP-dependent DNA helicase PcrA
MSSFSSLNPSQLEAVHQTDGPMMVLAGAGSGKTKTLVAKITYLLDEKKVSPYHILALTFSNKAAKEMRERIGSGAGETFSFQITTFHSFCARVLRKEFSSIGLSRNFSIYDDAESNSVIKSLLARRNISQKEVAPSEVKYFINYLKNNGIFEGCEQYKDYYNKDDWTFEKSELFYQLFIEYERELHQSNALDFGGLITSVVQLFLTNKSVLDQYQSRFRYLLVDEYQDTNRAQFNLVHLLARKTNNICVVGDEDQSIYSWRGADINNILDFEKYFPNSRTIKLEQNYRSSKNIIEAASHVIEKNIHRKGKSMWTDNPNGEKIRIIECADDREESKFIKDEAQKQINQGVSANEIAIFYRANSQSRLIEDELRASNIPYRIVGGIKFYDRKEVKDLISYLKLVANPKDSLAFSRVINLPSRGVGATTLKKLEFLAIEHDLSLYETTKKLMNGEFPESKIRITQKAKQELILFFELIEQVIKMNQNGSDPSECYEKILIESGYLDSLKKSKSYENLARIENLEELGNGISQFEQVENQLNNNVTISHYLETISLDDSINQTGSESLVDGQISLMTIHGSKGLEYETVFVAGIEENLFPSFQSIEEGDNVMEEERRLFYVAMTRAMRNLFLCFAKSRMQWGSVRFNEPSRFLFEIPEEYYLWESKAKKQPVSREQGVYIDYDDEFNQSYSRDLEDSSKYRAGQPIKHKLFGVGSIVKTEGVGQNEKITIKFSNGTMKKFIAKYAPLEEI